MSEQRERELTRRTFLQQAGGGVMATPLSMTLLSCAQATPQPAAQPGKKLGWAIVGLGNYAVNQILPRFEKCEHSKVVAFVSGSPDKANKLAAQYKIDPKNIYNYQTYDRLRDNSEIDIVYVILPNGMHAEYTIRGAQAGKHVLVEKPMANTVRECEQMIEACRRADRKLMIGYRSRFEPHNQEAIRMTRAQEMGPTKVILADHGFPIGDPRQWRLKADLAGGGSLMDIGIYSLQAARYLTGEEPVEVSAMIYSTPGDERFKEVEENVNFILRFPSGVLANCTSSYSYSGQSHYRVVGVKGWFELEPATGYGGHRMRVSRGGGVEEKQLPTPPKDQFAAQLDHMSQSVMNNTEPLVPGEEGLRDLRVMMAIYEAARSGKTIKL